MKRYLSIFFLLALLVYSCTPGSNKPPPEKSAFIQVLSTTEIIADLVKQIGRERINHSILIQGEIDPHSYELVKGDDEKISEAQVIFSNGLGLEHGASLRHRLETHDGTVFLGDEIAKSHPDQILYVDGVIDPHIWMDLSLWANTIDIVAEKLAQCDPDGAEKYRANAKSLYDQMATLDQELCHRFTKVAEHKRYLVTSHDAFNYFARRYLATPEELKNEQWRTRFIAPEGLAPDGQLSLADLKRVIDHLHNFQISVIFGESNVSRDSLAKITKVCLEKGCPVHLSNIPLYGDTFSKEAAGYLAMIKHNADTILTEWEE